MIVEAHPNGIIVTTKVLSDWPTYDLMLVQETQYPNEGNPTRQYIALNTEQAIALLGEITRALLETNRIDTAYTEHVRHEFEQSDRLRERETETLQKSQESFETMPE